MEILSIQQWIENGSGSCSGSGSNFGSCSGSGSNFGSGSGSGYGYGSGAGDGSGDCCGFSSRRRHT